MLEKLEKVLSIPKSLYFCLRSMPCKTAFKLPIIVSYRTKLKSLKGKVICSGKRVRIGFGGSGTAVHKPCSIENNGIIYLGNQVNFGGGCQICTVNNDSELRIGNNTSFMAECHVVAKKNIVIGNDCLISWDTQIMDSDLHNIFSEGKIINDDDAIVVEDHVWICSKAILLKGTYISKGTLSLVVQ